MAWRRSSRDDSRTAALRHSSWRGRRVPACIIRRFSGPDTPMEAERINAIANRLADLARREAELRRYL
jgi:hypothetical protein